MVIGIDPGLKGGICLAWEHRNWEAMPMPVVGGGIDLVQLKLIMNQQIHHVLDRLPATLVVIEKVHSMPKQGVVSSFKFGDGFGSLKTACVFLDLPFILVTPQRWKKVVLAGYNWKGNKDASIVWVKQRYPAVSLRPTERSRVDSHGLADAVCLAQYGIESMG